jgi:predicted DNA-binding transcriptional regulator AlpA
MTLSLDAIADGAPLDGLNPAEASALLSRLAAAQTRLAGRLLELTQLDDHRDNHDRLLDAKQAAERLGVASAWLYRHAGQLPFTTRVGAHLRFSERGLDRFIRSRTGVLR